MKTIMSPLVSMNALGNVYLSLEPSIRNMIDKALQKENLLEFWQSTACKEDFVIQTAPAILKTIFFQLLPCSTLQQAFQYGSGIETEIVWLQEDYPDDKNASAIGILYDETAQSTYDSYDLSD